MIEIIVSSVQIISGVLLVLGILIQRTDAGVGGAFGGGDSEAGHTQRRGSEKIIFVGTIVLAIIFIISIVFPLVVNI